ncbi:hypothetical protein QBC37DRAFT_410847 [Rhypophila decipiens]|uniref:Uncharacterized protein n=1 Tax=Rhypophila decipiens TaxID=261697 RepID=A0AAN6YJK4_9PEZI|nr:hypothetical protein QBC37DRAFT_410847 [Rhypophila decipiens]
MVNRFNGLFIVAALPLLFQTGAENRVIRFTVELSHEERHNRAGRRRQMPEIDCDFWMGKSFCFDAHATSDVGQPGAGG